MRKVFFADNTLDSAATVMSQVLSILRQEQLTSRSLFLAELVLEEMLTNIIKYAYDDDGPHRIEVLAEVQGDRVILELGDDGHHFDPSQVVPVRHGGPVSNRVQGGFGIQLVRKHVDHFDYERYGNLNILRVDFSASASENAPKS